MAGLVREPGRAGQVANGIEAGHAGAPEAVDFHMRLLDLDAELFQAKPLHIADNADGEDHAVSLDRLGFAAGLDARLDLVLAFFERFHLRLGEDADALLFELFVRHGRDVGVFDRQDAVHHLDHGDLTAKLIIETGKFDPDGTRADDQQLFRQRFGHHGLAIGPDQLAVRLQPSLRNGARAGPGGEHHMGGGVGRVLVILALHDHARRGFASLKPRGALDHGDLVLLHQVFDARRKLRRHAARALDDGFHVKLGLDRFQAKLVGGLHQVEDFRGTQERLGRDTAPIEADAAQRLALDNRGLQPKLAGPDRGDIAARPGTDDDEVEITGHCVSLVGWVERSETHRWDLKRGLSGGFRCALPTLRQI